MQPLGEFCIPAGHPSLPGHFPGCPVVPGVVLLDAAFALILAQQPGRWVAGVPTVKFTRPVRPGQRVAVSLGALLRSSCGDGVELAGSAAPQRVAFACAVDGQDVLRGIVTLGQQR